MIQNATLLTSSSVLIRPPSSRCTSPIPARYEFLTRNVDKSKYLIRIRHPGYDDGDDLMLSLRAFDDADGGLHYGFVHTACAIVADNSFDGYLSRTRDDHDGRNRVQVGTHSILPSGDYWFHVPRSQETGIAATATVPYRYPVVPSFQEWQFPHRRLPKTWGQDSDDDDDDDITPATVLGVPAPSTLSAAVQRRDVQCRVTAWTSNLECAQIVPEHEKPWFMRNHMAQYNYNDSLSTADIVRDLKNVTLLRSDIHTEFDNRGLVFFPKSRDRRRFVAHSLKPTGDILPLYHNVTVDVVSCAAEFLFARFAWAIFPSLSAFLTQAARPRLVVQTDQRTRQRRAIELDSVTLDKMANISRSSSPTQRSRMEASMSGDGEGILSQNQHEDTNRSSRHRRAIDEADNDCSENSLQPVPKRRRHDTASRDSRISAQAVSKSILQHQSSPTSSPSLGPHLQPSELIEEYFVATTSPMTAVETPYHLASHHDAVDVETLRGNFNEGKTQDGDGVTNDYMSRLRETALESQRPPGYISSLPVYDRHRPALEELRLLSLEILSNLSDDENL
ncbi:hypothetical protein F5X99DRAFT_390776 [Biscogniauxia marginata]|nr:hypothetical protein F5X99DRAFT_390776 [Biscogniauxia marginata]